MYKDKEKQKVANRAAAQRRRDKGMTKGMTQPGYDAGMTRCGHPTDMVCGECNAIAHTPAKPTFDDLPADVQYQIEQHCSENNNGARAGSHSRQAMTERALAYQAQFGKRPGQGVVTA